MTEERKREVIANYCGLTNPEEFPDYLNDHDAIDQVVKNLSDYDLEDYRESLYCIVLRDDPTYAREGDDVILNASTAAQKSEAFLDTR